jgi:hypothetical protein
MSFSRMHLQLLPFVVILLSIALPTLAFPTESREAAKMPISPSRRVLQTILSFKEVVSHCDRATTATANRKGHGCPKDKAEAARDCPFLCHFHTHEGHARPHPGGGVPFCQTFDISDDWYGVFCERCFAKKPPPPTSQDHALSRPASAQSMEGSLE